MVVNLKFTYRLWGIVLNRLDEPTLIEVSKPLLTEFDIHHRLESCGALQDDFNNSTHPCQFKVRLLLIWINQDKPQAIFKGMEANLKYTKY